MRLLNAVMYYLVTIFDYIHQFVSSISLMRFEIVNIAAILNLYIFLPLLFK